MTAMMNTVFHVDLSDADPEEDYWISTGGRKQMLQKHTEETRSNLLGASPHLMARQDRLTHFTQEPLQLPADQVIRVHVRTSLKNQPGAHGVWGVTHSAIHIPPPEHELQALQSSGRAHSEVLDYVSTAKNLVFHHPELITKDRRLADIIYGYMDDDKNISMMFDEVATHMRQLGPPSETSGWAKLVPFTPEENAETGYDGKTTYYQQIPVQSVIDKMGPVMTAMMIATKNDLALQGKKWNLQEGTAVQSSSGHQQLTLAAQLTAEGEDWRVALANTTTISGMYIDADVTDSANKKVKLTFSNIYIRYLGAYICFFDTNGDAMKVPDWKPDDNWVATVTTDILNNQYDDLRYLGHIGPVNNIFAIPIVGDPGKLTVTVTMPKGAVRADVFGSGLGTGKNLWPKTPLVGGVLTGIFNLGVPAFMLGFQVAAQSYKPLYDIVEKLSSNKKFIAAVVLVGGAFYEEQFRQSAVHGEMNWGAFTSLSSLIFNKAATKALLWIEATTVAEKAAEQIPFAGWIMIAINICLGVAQLAQTIVEVATSPWNIRNAIATSITTNVSIGPDPRHTAFPTAPAGAKVTYTVKMIYKDEKRPTVSQTHEVPEGSTETSLKAAFPKNTLGGQVKFEADYYIGTWLAGKATTGWIDNDDEHVSSVNMAIVEFPKPLDEKSVYKHSKILTFRDGVYSWLATDRAPVSTQASRDSTTGGNGISDWFGIALSQKMGMIGFAWRAAGLGIPSCLSGQTGQLAAMQNINIPGTPMNNGKFPTCAFDGSTQLIYDPFPPRFLMENGQWKLDPRTKLPVPDPADAKLGNYFVDPRKADVAIGEGGGFHMRQVALDAPGPFDVNGTLSWGRFRFFPDSFALHPSGYLIAISTEIGKIQVTKLEEKGKPDNQVPLAFAYAGEAHLRDRKGLLFHPIAVACAYDGTVLILEDTKSSTGTEDKIVSRIQAFDLYGNPVNRFIDGQGQPSPFLQIAEDRDIIYLDMAVVGGEKLTYMYVLYYRGTGTTADDYHMTIYQYGTEAPAKNPLVTTDRLSAAKLTVDMWHTVYALNYEMTTDGNGKPAGPAGGSAPAAGRTVPSVSEWLPPIPSK
jgi:hypothetical protein